MLDTQNTKNNAAVRVSSIKSAGQGLDNNGLRKGAVLTTIIRQFISNGTENSSEMKRPLLSKYCCRENNLQIKQEIIRLSGLHR